MNQPIVRYLIFALATAYAFNLGQGMDTDFTVVFNALEIDFQAAGRGTKLGEILIQLRHPAAQIGVSFYQKNIRPYLRSFQRCRQAANTAAND